MEALTPVMMVDMVSTVVMPEEKKDGEGDPENTTGMINKQVDGNTLSCIVLAELRCAGFFVCRINKSQYMGCNCEF